MLHCLQGLLRHCYKQICDCSQHPAASAPMRQTWEWQQLNCIAKQAMENVDYAKKALLVNTRKGCSISFCMWLRACTSEGRHKPVAWHIFLLDNIMLCHSICASTLCIHTHFIIVDT